MEFHGYNVNNLSAYRLHFTVQDLMDNISNVFTLNDWMSKIRVDGQMDDLMLKRLHQSIVCWVGKTRPENPLEAGGHPNLERAFEKWRERILAGKETAFESFQQLLFTLLDLAQHQDLSEAELRIVWDFLNQSEIISDYLRLVRKDEAVACLYSGDLYIHEMPLPLETPVEDAVWIACHPDTGYLAIDGQGRIVNGSAFDIPELRNKAVMADLNQFGYVILLEDGEIMHNLLYADAPQANFRPIVMDGYGFKTL